MNTIKFIIIEPSVIVRTGLEQILKKNNNFKVSVKILSTEAGIDYTRELSNAYESMLLVNPICLGPSPRVKYNIPNSTKIMAISYISYHNDVYTGYDSVLNLGMSANEVCEMVVRMTKIEHITASISDSQNLTSREREIVVCVVKGLTNKQIADKLYLSTHTVITHRRNITKKLQIHSTSGLTIYAIMNKLVELNDIDSKE